MVTRVDHIDMRVADLEETVTALSRLGLQVLRRTQAPRSSVEMALPGADQVVFELRPAGEDGRTGVHHIAFRQSGPEDVERLKAQGVSFLTEHTLIRATGRTVSSFADANGQVWQLTD